MAIPLTTTPPPKKEAFLESCLPPVPRELTLFPLSRWELRFGEGTSSSSNTYPTVKPEFPAVLAPSMGASETPWSTSFSARMSSARTCALTLTDLPVPE